jgi:hypothetical protein
MCGSEQGHAPDPKSLTAFGPGDACRSVIKELQNFNCRRLKLLIVFTLLFHIGCTEPTLQGKFGINMPENAIILATDHSTGEVDWSVAWLIEVHSKKENIISDFVPKGFEVLPYSDESFMKNHYYRTEIFNKMFDSESFKDGDMDIYIGGPDGHSLIAISKDKKQIIYYRFKT